MEITTQDYYALVIEYINANDIFWLEDLRKHLGCKTTNCYEDVSATRINTVIQCLKKTGKIICCEKRGTRRQFMVANPQVVITIKDIKDGTKILNHQQQPR